MAQSFDVCIRGGGMVGSTLALLLAQQRLRVGWVTGPDKAQDVRAYSLNARSRALLESVRSWPDETHATAVQQIKVWGDDGGAVQFDAPAPQALSWIVDVASLEAQLRQAVHYQSGIEVLSAPAPAALTVICEGRHSSTRAALGVQFDTLPYQQHALATRVHLSQPHAQQALQWFTLNAHKDLEILALLPLGGAAGCDMAVVWSLPPDRAQTLLHLQADAFSQALSEASHHALGALSLTSERAVWPLQLAQARQWTGRLPDGTAWVLAGDAAHNIHPLAGLGLNLGLADAETLAQVLRTREHAEHWRSVGDARLLRRYERARKADMLPTWLACDGLQRLFAHPHDWAQSARNWGLSRFNQISPLKQWALQQAMH